MHQFLPHLLDENSVTRLDRATGTFRTPYDFGKSKRIEMTLDDLYEAAGKMTDQIDPMRRSQPATEIWLDVTFVTWVLFFVNQLHRRSASVRLVSPLHYTRLHSGYLNLSAFRRDVLAPLKARFDSPEVQRDAGLRMRVGRRVAIAQLDYIAREAEQRLIDSSSSSSSSSSSLETEYVLGSGAVRSVVIPRFFEAHFSLLVVDAGSPSLGASSDSVEAPRVAYLDGLQSHIQPFRDLAILDQMGVVRATLPPVHMENFAQRQPDFWSCGPRTLYYARRIVQALAHRNEFDPRSSSPLPEDPWQGGLDDDDDGDGDIRVTCDMLLRDALTEFYYSIRFAEAGLANAALGPRA
jgi:hypothetical protein